MEKSARKLKRFQYSNYGFSRTSQLLDLGSLQTSQSARKLKGFLWRRVVCSIPICRRYLKFRLRFPLRGSVFCRHRLSSPVILKTQLARLISNFVDAFIGSTFKGNPAAVCLLEEDKDDQWLQVLAAEFNLFETCYLTWLTDSGSAPRCCINLVAKHLFSPKFCKQ